MPAQMIKTTGFKNSTMHEKNQELIYSVDNSFKVNSC